MSVHQDKAESYAQGLWSRAGREAGVASAAHGGTKSVQSTEGDLLGPTGPTFKQMSAGSKCAPEEDISISYCIGKEGAL